VSDNEPHDRPEQEWGSFDDRAADQPARGTARTEWGWFEEPAAATRESRPSLPVWVWPTVAVIALVLGLAGGTLAGALMARTSGGGDGSGGVLAVERRTAAPLPADNGSIAAVADKVLPSTVQIRAGREGSGSGATGSGFVFDEQGHVITNNHVVAQADEDGGDIEIIDHDGKTSKAEVVGRSTVYDVAVLKSRAAESLEPIALGSADQMRVGETVVAVGSPLGLSATVTSGIVSAVNRPVTTGEGENDNSYINAVQTDAAINPGNSGGPLVNLQGQVVGVNSAIASMGSLIANDSGGNIGVGFAIPIEQVQVTTDQILRTGKAQYPVIGADVRGVSTGDGARIMSISRGLPAADADLRVGDVIRQVDGEPVTGSIDLVVAIRSHVPGEKVRLTVERGKRTIEVTVGLEAKTG
jgi:putative serine protease PepD